MKRPGECPHFTGPQQCSICIELDAARQTIASLRAQLADRQLFPIGSIDAKAVLEGHKP